MKRKYENMKKLLRSFMFLAILILGITGTMDSSLYLQKGLFKSFTAQDVYAKSKKNKKKEKKQNKDQNKNQNSNEESQLSQNETSVSEDGTYTSKDEVAAYIHAYNHLPSNFIKKRDAQDLGWDSSLGNLDEVAPGMSIGGDKFGNYEGKLPEKNGRKYFECDINYDGGYRGAERIIYSNDGAVYYTNDHYNTFTQLY